jgi:hypothetical protein
MAAQALYNISGFVSDRSGSFINDLTFANKPPASDYGGNFGTAPCPPDINIPSDLTQTNPSGLEPLTSIPNTTLYNGNLTIGSITNYSSQATLYVEGNVNINNNIAYSTTSNWHSLSDIPNLRIVATGNIYINSSVTSLDGEFIAKGSIYDCTVTTSDIGNYAGPGCYSNSLTVNGSFIANEIYLQRTGGNLYTNSLPAETFNYGPAEWLAPQGNTSGTLTQLLNLPPIL